MKTYKVTVNDSGTKFWYNQQSQLHNEEGPAVEYADGSKAWYINNLLHREDGPAVECANGPKYWYINGKYHRENGPAVEYANDTKLWYINGQLHREDGPAVEWANGNKSWYIKGKQLTEEEFNKCKYPQSCDGKIVEIEGKRYKLTELKK